MTFKVLVVDDSQFFRRKVSAIINAEPRLEVVDIAVNGQDAIEKAAKIKPDVITMDIEMPVMNGITAVRQIMQHSPTPILMFSAFTREGATATLNALDAGALDFFPKVFEDISVSKNEVEKLLQQKLCDLAHKKLSNSFTSSIKNKDTSLPLANKNLPLANKSLPLANKGLPLANSVAANLPFLKKFFKTSKKQYQIVAFGSSTGGPTALQNILTFLPANFPCPIILVQHMPAAFTATFAERLNGLCAINVKEAVDGERLQLGTAYLAPGGKQLIAKKAANHVLLKVYDSGNQITYNPSIDITFASIAKIYTNKILSIVLTGMGSDGKEGANLIKQQGSTVWAQDEDTSVVYGMPKAVVTAGIATESLAMDRIAERILVELSLGSD